MNRDRSPKRRKLDTDRLPTPDRDEHGPGLHRKVFLKREHADNKRTDGYYHSSSSRLSTHTSRASTPRPHQRAFASEPDIKQEPQEDSTELDRDWYLGDDSGHVFGDESHNPFAGGYDATYEQKQQEKALASKKLGQRMTARAVQKQREVDAWETNRMLGSGVAQKANGTLDFEDDEDTVRVHLLVHELRPPFLDGKTVFTKQTEPVSAVRDAQSDMAVFARKGSKVVKEKRQQKERQKQAQEATNVAGTQLGNLLGVKEEPEGDSALDGDNKVKSNNKFTTNPRDVNRSSHDDKNKTTSNFARSKTLKEQREFLPAFAVREELLRVMRDNQVVIVVGQTGSGKTTQLTQFLFEEGYAKHGLIGCTQPRRVAAMSVAKRVAEEMEVELGGTVGYAIRFEDCTSKETQIKYMTDGVLLRESLTQPTLDKYSCLIMDEAHERALNTDILLGLLKTIITRRRDLKLIITSATLNATRFSDFFGGAPSFTIPGRTFPVSIQYSRSPCEDYVDSAVKQTLAIHVSQPVPGDILVFMTGQEDIEVTCSLLEERLTQLNDPSPLLILPIYSQMPADLQSRIFDPAPDGTRKVIVATNIAETSLTVDGITYVVDTGFSKLKVYNPRIGMDTLQVTPISQANASQRAGRAGRTAPGKSYHLYTEAAFKDELYVQTIPEIQRTNLANTILLLKSLNVEDLLDFPFLDPPPEDVITASLYDLWSLGALSHVGHLTSLGKSLTPFPLDPSLSTILVTSTQPKYSCSNEILTIVAMLSVPSVFYRPPQRQEESDAAREKFFVPESDHLTLLHVYTQWLANSRSDAWCTRHFLHPKTLRRAAEIRAQLLDILTQQNLPLLSAGTDWDTIRQCICAGYYHQAARARGVGEYTNLRTAVTVQLHPTSALYGLGYLPPFVVYHELILTSKEYMSTVTAVEPTWLAELGGVFYALKSKEFDERAGRVVEGEISRKSEIEAEMKREWVAEGERLARLAEQEDLRAGRARKIASGGSSGNGGGNGVGGVNGSLSRKSVATSVVKKPVVTRRKMGRL